VDQRRCGRQDGHRVCSGNRYRLRKARRVEKSSASADLSEAIANINQRVERSEQLDFEKIQEQVRNAIHGLSPEDEPTDLPSAPFFPIACFILLRLCRYGDDTLEKIGLSDDDTEDWMKTPRLRTIGSRTSATRS
jgi:hypothetical protein